MTEKPLTAVNSQSTKQTTFPIVNNDQIKLPNSFNLIIWKHLNATETKILTVILGMYGRSLNKQKDWKKVVLAKTFNIPFIKIKKKINALHSNVSLCRILHSLQDKVNKWGWIDFSHKQTNFALSNFYQIDKKAKMLKVKINPNLLRFLLFDGDKGFFQYPEREIINLSSVNAMSLLRLLKRFRYSGHARFVKRTKEDDTGAVKIGLWDQLRVKKAKRESVFYARTLKPALINISPYFGHLNCKKNYGTFHGHRVVSGYLFIFDKENYGSNENVKDTQDFLDKGFKNIKSAICLTREDKFVAIDHFLKQKRGTARKAYIQQHPEYHAPIKRRRYLRKPCQLSLNLDFVMSTPVKK